MIHRQPNTKCLLHLLQRGQYISYTIMYYRSPCLFFRNTVRSASSCSGFAKTPMVLEDSGQATLVSGTLARPRSCSETRQTTPCSGTSRQTTPSSDHVDHISSSSAELRPRLGDFVARSSTCARGLPRPRLGDFVARSSTYARGLPRPLSDHSSGTLRLDYMRQTTRIQLGIFFLI